MWLLALGLLALLVVFLVQNYKLSKKHKQLTAKKAQIDLLLYELYREGKIGEQAYRRMTDPGFDENLPPTAQGFAHSQNVQAPYIPIPPVAAKQYTVPTPAGQTVVPPTMQYPNRQPLASSAPDAPQETALPWQQSAAQQPLPAHPQPVYSREAWSATEGLNQSRLKKKINPVNLILILGVTLVVLAGLIFTTTTWRFLSDITKIITASSFSVLFFGVSVLADKRLKLKNTAMAFYSLGSIFVPITFIGLGFFELLGSWLSFQGDGRFFLAFAAAAGFCIAGAVGTANYQSKMFADMTLGSLSLSVIFLCAFFAPTNEVVMICFTLFAAAVVFMKDRILIWERAKNSSLAILVYRLRAYSLINLFIAGFYSIFLCDFSMVSTIAALLCAGCFFKETLSQENEKGYYPAFFSLLLLGCLKFAAPGQIDRSVLLSSFVVFAVTAMSVLSLFHERVQKALRIGCGIVSLLVFMTNGISLLFSRTLSPMGVLATALVYLCLVLISLKENSKPLYCIHAVIAVALLAEVVFILPDSMPKDLLFCVLMLAAFLLYRLPRLYKGKMLQTMAGDAIFPLAALFTTLFMPQTALSFYAARYSLATGLEAIGCALILCVILVLLILDRHETIATKAAAYLLPFVTTVLCVLLWRIRGFYGGTADLNMLLLLHYIVLTLAGIAAFVLGRRFTVFQRLSLPLFVHIAAQSLLGTLLGCWGFVYYFAFTWGLGVYLLAYCGVMQRGVPEGLTSGLQKASYYIGGSVVLLASWFSAQSMGVGGGILTAHSWVYALYAPALLSAGALIFSHISDKLPNWKKPWWVSGMMPLALGGASITSLLAVGSHYIFDHIPYLVVLCITLCTICYYGFFIRRNTAACLPQMLLLLPVVYGKVFSLMSPQVLYRSQFAVLCLIVPCIILSLILHRRVFEVVLQGGGRRRQLDCFACMTFFSLFALLPPADNNWRFYVLLLFATFTLSLYRRISLQYADRILLTLMGGFITAALCVQPFSVLPTEIATEYLLLIPVIYVFVLRFVWSKFSGAMRWIFYIVCTAALLVLSAEALIYRRAFDVTVLGLLAVLLIGLPFFTPHRRWYYPAAATLMFVWWAQPIIAIPPILILEYIMFAPVLFIAGLYILLKQKREIVLRLLYAYTWISMPLLLIDSLRTGFPIDSILLFVLSAGFIVYAYRVRQLKWYLPGAASLIIYCWSQQMVSIPQIISLEINAAVPVCLFAATFVFWGERKKTYETVLFTLSVVSTVLLVADGIRSQSPIDALIVGVLMLSLLIVSFIRKKQRWLLFSAITILGLVINMTKTFWMSLAWWIYLLAAGIVLIAVAAANEAVKQKGEGNLTNKVKTLLKDWNW